MKDWKLPDADTYFRKALQDDPRGFQIDHLNSALAHCKRFRTAIDGGAHVGTWSVAMADRFDYVVAFEPARDTFRCLAENTRELMNVIVMNNAIGNVQSRVVVGDDPQRKGNTGSRFIQRGVAGDIVQMFAIDDLGLTDVDFLKLDVEGFELMALQGAAETINRCHPVVLIEVKRFDPPRFGVDHEAAARHLESIGYREVERVRNDRIYVWNQNKGTSNVG